MERELGPLVLRFESSFENSASPRAVAGLDTTVCVGVFHLRPERNAIQFSLCAAGPKVPVAGIKKKFAHSHARKIVPKKNVPNVEKNCSVQKNSNEDAPRMSVHHSTR